MSAQVIAMDGHTIYPDDPRSLPEGSDIDGRRALRAIDTDADYVVIGSGAGGATAAMVLAEAGFSVALVEEGGWIRTADFGNALFPAMKNTFRGIGTAATKGSAFIGLMQGRCVGGSTTINSAIAWRAPEAVFDDWSKRFGLGDRVSMKVLEPHFEVLEKDLHVRAVSDEALGLNNGLFGEAATALGFESHRIRRYDAGCEGSAGCLTGCKTGKKLSMNVSYIPRALHAGARIFTSARVERIETRGGRAVAVLATMASEAGNLPLVIRARRGVFVGASTVQTPNILRRSGLRARAIGKHFQAHPGVSMMALMDRPIQMDYGASQGYNSLAFLNSDRIKLESLSLPTELAVSRLPGFGEDLMRRLANYGSMATWAVVIRSEAEGDVRPGFGEDAVRYVPNVTDMQRARKGLKKLCEMMFALGAKEMYPGVFGMPPVLTSPDELHLWDSASDDPRSYNMITSHMFGAARMGNDPNVTAVDTNFQTHEVQGLYVVDSSVFPTNLGVNPQHTIMAMARLAASRTIDHPLAPI